MNLVFRAFSHADVMQLATVQIKGFAGPYVSYRTIHFIQLYPVRETAPYRAEQSAFAMFTSTAFPINFFCSD